MIIYFVSINLLNESVIIATTKEKSWKVSFG